MFTFDRSVLVVFPLLGFAAGCGSSGSFPDIESGVRELNGTRLFVKTMGAGDPLIIVHGGPVLEHGYLLPHLEPLAKHYRLIFFDQRLSGRSSADVDAADMRMENLVADVEALRESEGLHRFHLMAHSWGGLIAMHYAASHADRLESLVLLDSMPGSSDLWRQEQAELGQRVSADNRELMQAIRESEAYANKEPGAYRELYRLSFRSQFAQPERMDRLHFYIAPDLDIRSQRFGAVMQDVADYDIHAALADVDVPALLLYGSDEVAVKLSGPELRRHLPDTRLVVVPDAGHFPFVEQPAVFLREVLGFLADHS